VDKSVLIKVLKEEIEKSTGCTDPGAVSLAVSRATKELCSTPEKIKVTVSPNIYKNGISVWIPGTGKRGLHMAAALGAIIKESNKGLDILDYVDEDKINQALELMRKSCVETTYANTPDPYILEPKLQQTKIRLMPL
jgi:L-cysteine desulfidase